MRMLMLRVKTMSYSLIMFVLLDIYLLVVCYTCIFSSSLLLRKFFLHTSYTLSFEIVFLKHDFGPCGSVCVIQ